MVEMINKICPICNILKNIDEYTKCLNRKDGLQIYCKSCHKIKYKESKRLSDKKYNEIWKGKPENILKKKIYSKLYNQNNPEKRKIYSSKYRKSEKGVSARKIYRKKEYDEKYGKDLQWTLKLILRNRLKNAIKNNFKKGQTLILLGYSIPELLIYFKEKYNIELTASMIGKEKGKWTLDHIKPCSKFDLSKPEEQAICFQQAICFHYSNLQPMLFEDNIKKGAKYE